MMNSKDSFSFTYSSKEREEVKRIREKYTKEQNEENKLERLRALDERVTRISTTVSLILGIVGTLILGFGMSLIMTDLGDSLGVFAIVLGLALGIVGIAAAALAYPAYIFITRREREKIAPEMIRLSNELLKQPIVYFLPYTSLQNSTRTHTNIYIS